MKTMKFFLIVFLAMGIQTSCSSQGNDNTKNQASVSEGEVTVYYSHFKRRCYTCIEVEKVSKEAVAELYNGAVSFRAINLDEPEGKAEGEKLGINGQALMVVQGSTKIDLTLEGFMNAVTKPEQLKNILQEKIDPLIR
ncbi:MAG: nitrophenyl compound nitroreductase subunit ArsF family protein [Bacteroidales bacterium]|nr:nitrophenyl compound nitroreductase subunit ArsF family protein [Bacteroidales bacterium]